MFEEIWMKKMNNLIDESKINQSAWNQAVDQWCEWAINNREHRLTSKYLEILRSKAWSPQAIENLTEAMKKNMKVVPTTNKEIIELADRLKANYIRVAEKTAAIDHAEPMTPK